MLSPIQTPTNLPRWVRVTVTLLVVAAFFAAGSRAPDSGKTALLAQEPELQLGDLVVGVHDGKGAIIRIRNRVATLYCKSQQEHREPMYFDTPKEVVIDGRGDVIFLAHLSTPTSTASIGPYGLWRCSAMGEPPELLGAFGSDPAFDHPRPLGPRPVRWAGGLHIKRSAGFDANTGEAATAETYVFAVADGVDAHRDTISFNPQTGDWGDYGVMDDPFQGPGYHQFDMINGGSGFENYTVSAAENGMKVVAEPVSVTFDIAGVLQASLAFQGVRELVGAQVDDLSVDLTDSHDCFAGYPGTPRNVFGTINGMSGINALGWASSGLVMQSDSFGMGHAFIPLADMVLFNINPFDDGSSKYVWPLDCSVRNKLRFQPWHPFNSYNDRFGIPRSVNVMSPDASVGTQTHDGRVIRLGNSADVTVLAEGLNAAPYVQPTGIDVYPGYQPTVSGLSVFVRIDSPVNVLITDASGRRLGVDPATGLPVNDFGEAGFDSQTDEPRIYGIRQPLEGGYTVDTIGTGTGPYHVTAFGVNHGTLAVTRAQFSGDATPGVRRAHAFAIDPAGEVISEPEGDHEPPVIAAHDDVTVAPASKKGAYVSYAIPAASDNSGVVSLSCAPAAGSLFQIGRTAVSCRAADGSGNTAASQFDVVVMCCEPALRLSVDSIEPGGTMTLIGKLNNASIELATVTASFEITGPVQLDVGSASIALGAGAGGIVYVPLTIDRGWPLGTYTVRMTMSTPSGSLARESAFQVRSPR